VKLPDSLPGPWPAVRRSVDSPGGPFVAVTEGRTDCEHIYMFPIKDFNPDKAFNDLASTRPHWRACSKSIQCWSSGVEVPHAH